MSPHKKNNEFLKQLKRRQRSVPAIYISTYIPRPCGLATYTKDLTNAINILNPKRLAEIMVMDKPEDSYPYPWEVKYRINMYDLASYMQAADYINRSGAEIVCLQHEFGIFGGQSGDFVVPFVERLNKPVVTTFHTVMKSPPPDVRNIVYRLGRKSAAVTVMANTCIERLKKYYRIPKKKIVVIPHGVPDVALTATEPYKRKLGMGGRIVISAINLMSDNKGLEYAIQALPRIARKHPEILLNIVGMTHPEVIKWQGETYRDSLKALARKLKVEKHLRFDNRYVTLEELIEYLMATDFYITPYLGADQTASGTMAYALAGGKLCISTPYVYAQEVLADGRGELVGFRQANEIAKVVNHHIEHPHKMAQMKKKAYDYGRQMIWASVADRHLDLFRLIIEQK